MRTPSALENHVVYSENDPGELFLIRNGQRHRIVDAGWLPANGFTWNQLQSVSKAELERVPLGGDIRPLAVRSLEGYLIKSPDAAPIYYVQGGVKHWVIDPKWITSRRYLAHSLVIVSPETISSIPSGAPFAYTSRTQTKLLLAAAFLFFCFLFFVSSFPSRIKPLIAAKCGTDDYRFRIPLLVVLVGCVVVRSLHLLRAPRFWAEEGTVWFQYALGHSAWSMLHYVFYLSGYLNLAANIAGVLSGTVARMGHMLQAPLASTLVALTVQCLPFVVLCLGKSTLFDARWKLAVMGVLILVLPGVAPEIWVNSINSMSFAGLTTLLLLFVDNLEWRAATRWGVRGLLVFCGLTGVYSMVLAPFYFVRYWYGRSREYAIQGALLSAAGLVQAASVVYFKLHGGLPTRGEAVASLAPINVLYYHVAMPFIGQDLTRLVFRFFGIENAWWVANSYPHWPDESTLLAGWASAILIAALLIWLSRRDWNHDRLLLGLIFATYSILTTVGSLEGIPASRYAFLPGVTILMLVLSNVGASRYGLKAAVCSAAIAMALTVGIVQFYRMQTFWGSPWRDEVAKWENDHGYGLKVWPAWWTSRIYDPPRLPYARGR